MPAAPSPALTAPAGGELAAQADQDMSDPQATCSVRRNDTGLQVLQPKPKQVEWAADLAVKNDLMKVRPAGWNSNGLQFGYEPQMQFPQPRIEPNGGQVPAQILLGILGQESNLWQASRHVMPGEFGNPLIGNFYGIDLYNGDPNDDWTVRFDKADCGYGVSQMTDGMRLAGREGGKPPALPYSKQVMIATDYAANVAAGLQLLIGKWNQLQTQNMGLHDNNPSRIENWFFAAWAYNSGYHLPGEPGSDGAYGLGWGNNPANPRYWAQRHPFGSSPRDFATPQKWPNPEKVIGFASLPPSGFEQPGVEAPFFRPAWRSGTNGATKRRAAPSTTGRRPSR